MLYIKIKYNLSTFSHCKFIPRIEKNLTIYSVLYLFQFESFVVEELYDKVIIYDGSSENDPLVGTYSGNAIPNVPYSSSNFILVIFQSDQDNQMSGFNATFSAGKCSLINQPKRFVCSNVKVLADNLEMRDVFHYLFLCYFVQGRRVYRNQRGNNNS